MLLAAPASAQEKPQLRWGTDPTGGAPYVYQDAEGKFIGFEYEFAEYLASKLGRDSVKVDADWSTLPELLDKPRTGRRASTSSSMATNSVTTWPTSTA